jgi:hypothetical protein
MIHNYYNEWKYLIKEGDILLFKGNSLYSKFIQVAGNSPYTHVGIASWHNDILECVEFHEKHGGRSINLENYIQTDNREIDVYRSIPYFLSLKYNPTTKNTDVSRVVFDGKKLTDCMRGLSGLPYGWKRIWWIVCRKFAGLRLFYNTNKTIDDTHKDEIIYPVCSTALSHCSSGNSYDFVHNRSDEWTEPGDFARSTRLYHIFNIKKGKLKIIG